MGGLWEVGRGWGRPGGGPQAEARLGHDPSLWHPQVLWTGLPGPNLHLLVACAILDMERDTLMLSGFGSNEILKVRRWPLPPFSLPS